MVLMHAVDKAAGGFSFMTAVMIDPSFAEDLLAETARPGLGAEIIMRVRTGFVAFHVKRVSGGAKPDNGFSRFEVILEDFHLFVVGFSETVEEDQQVGVGNLFKSRQICLVVGVDISRFRVDGEENGAFESVAFG